MGGDFFDFIPLKDDRLAVIVGDVSDHGIPAAIFMALTFSLLRGEFARAQTPGEALLNANCHLLDMNESDMFVTLLCGILDFNTRHFQYVRAGHPPPVVLDARGREIELPRDTGTTLGLFDDVMLDEKARPCWPSTDGSGRARPPGCGGCRSARTLCSPRQTTGALRISARSDSASVCCSPARRCSRRSAAIAARRPRKTTSPW